MSREKGTVARSSAQANTSQVTAQGRQRATFVVARQNFAWQRTSRRLEQGRAAAGLKSHASDRSWHWEAMAVRAAAMRGNGWNPPRSHRRPLPQAKSTPGRVGFESCDATSPVVMTRPMRRLQARHCANPMCLQMGRYAQWSHRAARRNRRESSFFHLREHLQTLTNLLSVALSEEGLDKKRKPLTIED